MQSFSPFFLAPSRFPILLPAPIPHQDACIPYVYPTRPHATLWRLPAGPFLASCADCSYPFSRCLFARCCVSYGDAYFFLGGGFLRSTHGTPPAPFPLCVRALSRGFLSLLFCFTLLPASTHVITALFIGLRPPSVLVFGPLAPAGRSPWQSPAKPDRRPSLASPSAPLLPLASPPPALPPSPVPRQPPYCCSPEPCALRCSSPRQGCFSRALTPLSARSSVL